VCASVPVYFLFVSSQSTSSHEKLGIKRESNEIEYIQNVSVEEPLQERSRCIFQNLPVHSKHGFVLGAYALTLMTLIEVSAFVAFLA